MKPNKKRWVTGLTASLVLVFGGYAAVAGQISSGLSTAKSALAGEGEERPAQRKSSLRISPVHPAMLDASVSAKRSARDANQYRLPGSNTVLCGAMVYNDLWGVVDANGNYINPITAGIYTFEAKPGGKLTKVKDAQDMIKIRAGVKVNNLYYAISTSNSDTEAALTTYYASSWSKRSTSEIDVVNVPSDMTYDPVSGNVYGFFWNDTYQEYDRFCRFDTYYGEAEDISSMDRNCFAIAANAAGEIYGIWGYTGWLIKVNPKTGAYEQIGKTGFAPGYINSMTFDDATGKLYWAANDGAGESYLLEVDTNTGAATELYHFEDNASFAGIFAMPFKVPDAAPAEASDISVRFDSPGSTTAYISLTAPEKSYNGGTLQGPLTVAVSAGSEYCEIEGVNPGSRVETSAMVLPQGEVTVSVTVATATLLGPTASTRVWAGNDVPSAPTDFIISSDNGVPSLSWTAPKTGAHGGEIDPNALTYTVTRLPDKKTFPGITSTSWKDEDFSGSTSALQYTLKAVNAAGESPIVTSEKMIFGQSFTIPYLETFTTAEEFGLWTVFDLNGQTTWEYDAKNGKIFYSYSKDIEIPGDDWIISPRIKLEAGKTYQLSADASSYYKGYPENFKFALGKECSPEAMTQTVVERTGFENTKGETVRALFSVEETGDYHLGLYDFSIAHNWQLTIDNISIIEVSDQLPAAVEDLLLTPAEYGESKCTISFTMPSKDAGGNSLEGVLSANIYRDHSTSPAVTVDNLSAGATGSWTDEALGEAGEHHYRVVAVNEVGEGADNAVSGWVGMDIPGAVTDLTEQENVDGSVSLSWKAPEKGAHGGYFGTTPLTYRVIRSDGEVIAEALSTTSLTDRSLNLTTQELLYYLVTPYAGEVKGQYNNTDYKVYGPAYATPFAEGFPGADLDNYPWVSESDAPIHFWTLETVGIDPVATDHNRDGGMAMFNSPAEYKGKSGTLTGPKVNLAGLEKAQLSFWMYHTSGEEPSETGEKLQVLVSKNGGEFEPVEGAEFARDNGTTGWASHSVDLSNYSEAAWIQVQFKATVTGEGSFYIDDITINDDQLIKVYPVSVEMPSRVGAGIEIPVSVTVANVSNYDADGLLYVFSDNEPVGDKEISIPAGSEKEIDMRIVLPEKGEKELCFGVALPEPTGETSSSQASGTLLKRVTVTDLIVPAPREIKAITILKAGQASDNPEPLSANTLLWKSPYSQPSFTDDMESYQDWAVAEIGDYTMIDMDGDVTYYINKDLGANYPNSTSPKAFQVCNAATLGIDIWDEGTPHSGNKMMMAMANINYVNNDWMILPRLNGSSHTIRFFAKAFTSQDTPAERMKVLVSSTDKNPASFTPISNGEYLEVPDMWTEYTYVVPEGTNWVAINCVSDGAFALFVDDISFNDFTVMNLPIDHYNIYRNGVKIEEVKNWTEYGVEYMIEDEVNTVAYYCVSATFSDGTESPRSEEIYIEVESFGGVDSVTSAADLKAYAANGFIVIEASADTSYKITDASGKRVVASTGSGRYSMQPGMYLIRTSEKVIKVIL